MVLDYEVGDGYNVAAVPLVSWEISDHVRLLSHRLSLETLDVLRILTMQLYNRHSLVLR